MINTSEKHCISLHQALIELGHPQPSVPLTTDNKIAINLCNITLKQKHGKSIDMHSFLIKDQVKQNKFKEL